MAARSRFALVRVLALVALGALTGVVHAQVVSEGRGSLSLLVGEGSAPLGAVATDVVAGSRSGSEPTIHHAGYRITGGYQFATYVAFEAGIAHIGTFDRRAAYAAGDQLEAQTDFNAIETDLVAKWPFAQYARLDVQVGAAVTGLRTTLSTVSGSALPAGQQNPVNSKHLGAALGADLELRLSEHTSLLAGYHAYPLVGSSRLVGSASGTLSLLAAGVHFEF
ncbi:MAG: outer membrane beta-barrel protein [Proteobacteria bacterium]|nr:outer membrane beta-barrel protein [Pseudomonadota bacterium]